MYICVHEFTNDNLQCLSLLMLLTFSLFFFFSRKEGKGRTKGWAGELKNGMDQWKAVKEDGILFFPNKFIIGDFFSDKQFFNIKYLFKNIFSNVQN